MWLFTKTGFISVVRDRESGHELVVRARDRESLEPLSQFLDARIACSPNGDYPYRLFIEESRFKDWLLVQVITLNYFNFKTEVRRQRKDKFVDALHDVWAIMHGVEDDQARKNDPTWVDRRVPQGTKSKIQHLCGICRSPLGVNWALRQGQLCDQCENRAVDSKHREICITSQGIRKEGNSWFFVGPEVFYKSEADENDALEPCDEVNDSGVCWVDGVACRVWEGRLGGYGLVIA